MNIELPKPQPARKIDKAPIVSDKPHNNAKIVTINSPITINFLSPSFPATIPNSKNISGE